MAKINFKKIILTVATLAALAGAIKWFGDYQADRNFRKLPKQQQVYVDSLIKSGNINQNNIRDDISRLNKVKEGLEYLSEYVQEIEKSMKNLDSTKHLLESKGLTKETDFDKNFLATVAVGVRPRINMAREELYRLKSMLKKIQIFDLREIQTEVGEIEKRIEQSYSWLKSLNLL